VAATITPERLATIKQCVADGWPLIQIKRTHKVTWTTMRRHFPDYRGLDNQEAAKLGATARRTTLALRRAS